MYVYIPTSTGIYTVGFYDPDGVFFDDLTFDDKIKASERVHYLNGGNELCQELTQSRLSRGPG